MKLPHEICKLVLFKKNFKMFLANGDNYWKIKMKSIRYVENTNLLFLKNLENILISCVSATTVTPYVFQLKKCVSSTALTALVSTQYAYCFNCR